MNPILKLLIFSMLLFPAITLGQDATYNVTQAPFSSEKYDEFSPVYYRNGIVFSSNRKTSLIINHSDSLNRGMFKIYYIDTTGRKEWHRPKLFSKDLKTPFNDGPVTFNATGDTIYYSRNLIVEGRLNELAGPKNRLGIFYAVRDGDRWVRIREMRINNEWYNVSTPWLSPDGKKLYFASDKSGGYGGSDLYYSLWKADYWSDPVNLGPVINTPGNEAYPFINPAGDLYFASDGHQGMGGKDIFYSRFANSAWLPPEHIDPPINSQFDDFGIIADSLMNSGYFSSNREKTTDIFFFSTNIPQIFYSDLQIENQYCFKFTDEANILIDTNYLRFEWDFGDGSKATGQNVEHCFPGPGIYTVNLNILVKSTGREFFNKLSYKLDLKDVEQPFINSPEVAIVGKEISFDGRKSNLPGYEILAYNWQFSNEERASGESAKHVFMGKGVKEVKLGLSVRNKSTGISSQRSVSKKIEVFDNDQEAGSKRPKTTDQDSLPNIMDYAQAVIKELYSAGRELSQDAEFLVELMTSGTRIPINSPAFRNVPAEYIVKEIFFPEENVYSYVVDREMDLMLTLPAFNEMILRGFKNTRIRTYPLKDPAEKEIYNLKKIFGFSVDTFIDNFNKLTSNGYVFLDQITGILNKYPNTGFDIEVHVDNSGTPEYNLAVSQRRAQLMVNYLISKGIGPGRLSGKGFGGIRPIASNYSEAGKKLNRRIDYSIKYLNDLK